MRIDLSQALVVLVETRTKEMMRPNEMFESVGERIKDIIESGEELNDEEEKTKNNITRTINFQGGKENWINIEKNLGIQDKLEQIVNDIGKYEELLKLKYGILPGENNTI